MPPVVPADIAMGRVSRRRAAHLLGGLLAGAALGPLPACGKGPRGPAVPAGATVLALGDSITHGTGATPDTSYPAVLAQLTGWNVINAGVPGDTSAQALERLPGLLAQHAPQLVLVSIGGNDLLRQMPVDRLRENVRSICRLALAAGAQVLLVAVPRPTLSAKLTGSLSDHPVYEELAAELKVPLHRQGWSEVLADGSLKSDEIHANAEGYRRFAQLLEASAREAGLLGSAR
jgi:acyl-CoA thioesterase-1